MGVQTSSGSVIKIGTTAVNPVGDAYLEIGEVTNIGELGRVYNEITHTSLANRNTRKFKGNRNDGSVALDLGFDISDAGQTAVQTALDSDADYNFEVTLNDDDNTGGTPSKIYFKAKVMSFTVIIGNGESITMRRIQLGVQTGSMSVVAASS